MKKDNVNFLHYRFGFFFCLYETNDRKHAKKDRVTIRNVVFTKITNTNDCLEDKIIIYNYMSCFENV